ncbi:MAG: sulfite exporter TauE/SafE family protein [Myxococcales bacterium]|nr:sulfite exporter TauE/SafE family protein [Myxococcales bacterium]
MTFAQGALLVGAALLGGALNSVAGGGSFFTFPALILSGTSPLVANATSTVALWPGSLASAAGYWREVGEEGALVRRLAPASLFGGFLGAWLVTLTPGRTFEALVPFLLLVATLTFTLGERLRAALARRGPPSQRLFVALQLLIAIYGGYFGGGMGLMMLALFSLLGPRHLHGMNGLKSVLGVAINLAALLVFIVDGLVDWPRALVMTAAAVVGGYGGAALARRVDALKVKRGVVVLGWLITAAFFLETFS